MRFGTDGDGNYGYYGADGSLIPFNSGIPIITRCQYVYAGFNRSYTLGHDCKAVVFLNIGSNIDICYINNKPVSNSGYTYEIQLDLNSKKNLVIKECKKGDYFTFLNDSANITFDMVSLSE